MTLPGATGEPELVDGVGIGEFPSGGTMIDGAGMGAFAGGGAAFEDPIPQVPNADRHPAPQ
jgi:hypothetical protein